MGGSLPPGREWRGRGGGAGARRGGTLAVGRGWILKLGGRGKRSLAEREEEEGEEEGGGGAGEWVLMNGLVVG
jgi:hypothetical protein